MATADTVALVYYSGFVGHHGRCGCRIWCILFGRHKPGCPTYYPCRFLPYNYAVAGCDHPDVDFMSFLFEESQKKSTRYQTDLVFLMASRDPAEFVERRLQTGITKPSIFLGLPEECTLGVPGIFSQDIMHLCDTNIPVCHLDMWRAKMDCADTDDKATWDFAVLTGNTWKEHGKKVAACHHHLPTSFGRPPRNIAEKINSGYKTWEYMLYFFMLGPGLLYGILPFKYWVHYCKLVAAMRVYHQERIPADLLHEAYQFTQDWSDNFENLYVQRRADRIHFVRPCIHSVGHIPEEITRVGPGIYGSQWTTERAIGDYGAEIRQPSNPFRNLSERASRRAQVNALFAMAPELDPRTTKNPNPHGSVMLGHDFVLLRARDTCPRPMRAPEIEALRAYLFSQGEPNLPVENWDPFIRRWARLRLPNGQITRTLWKESKRNPLKMQITRHIKVCIVL